jgi:uncharacterized protein (TIGR02271 family)
MIMAQQTIVAYFDSRAQAETAQAALTAEGIDTGSIRLLPDNGSSYTRSSSEAAYDHRRDEGGFWQSLGDLFLPEEDRYSYAEGMSRGGAALSVTTDDTHYSRVAQILEHNGAADLDAREAEWRNTGWTGYTATEGTFGTPGLSSAPRTTASRDASVADDGVIEVVEEELRVGKRQVDRGSVRIRSYVVETPVEAEVELRSERVVLERRPVDRAATADDLRSGDQVLEARERSEEAVVSKQARVVEEIGLRSETEHHTETVSDTVRKTEVEIDDDRAEGTRLTDTERDLRRR